MREKKLDCGGCHFNARLNQTYEIYHPA
jgi:hypothetical protein